MKELKALIPYLLRYRWQIAAGIFAIVVANGFYIFTIEYLGDGVDVLRSPGTTRALVLRFAALSLAVAVASGVARFAMRNILNGVSRKVELDLRDDLFARLLRLDAPFHGAHPTGEIMSRATNDLGNVRMVAGPAYMYLVDTVVMTLFSVPRMVAVDGPMTAACLVPIVLLFPATLFFGNIIHQGTEAVQEQLGAVSTMAQENLAGQRIVKAYGQEAYQTRRMAELSGEYMRRNVRLAQRSGLFLPFLGLLGGLSMVLALWLGGRAMIEGRVTDGEFVAFLLYLGRLTWPMIALGWVVNLFQRGAASMGRVARILHAEPSVAEPAAPAEPGRVRGDVEFRGVSFRYPGTERWVLREVSFRVPAGATLAIVGPTGSGKSTVASLLARLYDPTEGEVCVDGVALTRWPLARLRESVAMVPQDTFLFSTTIEENLALGFEEGDDARRRARVAKAASVARLDSTIEELPGGYDTVLGERGINLSGGQKQRAALARAVARDARILVLDDALSAVDTHTEHEILDGLKTVLAGRTSVIVSHRVTAVMHADLILVMDDGRLVEQGTHAELLRRRGVYAMLQRRQLLAEDLAGDEAAGDDVLAAAQDGV